MFKNEIQSRVPYDSLLDFFSQAPVALSLLMGEEMVIEVANDQILQIWGKSKGIIGKPLLQGLPEISSQKFPEILERVFKSGKPYRGYQVQCFLERGNGLEECFFDFIYSPVFDSNHLITGVSVVATEVTSQVESQRKLSESELQFKELLLGADVPTAIYTGEDYIIELANEKMLATWGKDQSVIGKKLIDAIPELEDQPFVQLLEKVYKEGITYFASEDKVLLEIDGVLQEFYYNFSYKPIRNSKGEIYAILNMAVNVTDLVRSRNELQEQTVKLAESEQKYKALSEAVPQLIWTANPEGDFMYFNEKIKDYYLGEIEVLNRVFFDEVIHPDDRDYIVDIWENANQEKTGFQAEYRSKDPKSGNYIWQLTSAVPQLDENGQIHQWVGSSMDINELKILQEQKDTFLGVASHELKTPLTSMKIYTQLLERSLRSKQDMKNALYASKMDEQINKLTSLVADLLDVTKINSGKIEMNESRFDLERLVNEIVEEQQLSSTHKIVIQAADSCFVWADRHRIGQVISNLISNGIKYSPHTSTIEVELRCKDNEVKLLVRDYGLGLTQKDQEKVFDQYFRVGGEKNNTFPGLGLGLFIAAQIIERSKGKIGVKSAIGKGSTFYFTLPLSLS